MVFVRFNGAHTQEQLVGNFTVVVTLGKKLKHFQFSAGKLREGAAGFFLFI